MGNLLRLLSKGSDDSVDGMEGIVIDFENSTPSEEEKSVYEQVEAIIARIDSSTMKLDEWNESLGKGLLEDATDAFQQKLAFFLDLAEIFKQMEQCLPVAIEMLMLGCDSHKINEGNFQNSQSVLKIFAKLLGSSINFDITKLTKPIVCNDLSTIKRSLQRSENLRRKLNCQSEVFAELAIQIAYSDAILRKILMMVSNYLQEKNLEPRGAAKSFISLARVCKYMNNSPEIYNRFQSPDTRLFILKVMVVLLVMADHVHPEGVLSDNNTDLDSFLKLLLHFPENCGLLAKILKFQTRTGPKITKPSVLTLLDKAMKS